eukprot:TRINITY_DN3829_c0_g1_i1.p2 TRINITY_DN3829_c0_g1~~TRINITY_DN3829_c0_g1_i1.p2  ORF type:complete len:345 (-),score=108.98 TRINITY_DN3829_c0_g1_i1:67-1101(-)
MRALAAVLLLALVASSFAQTQRLTDVLGSFAGRGFDIVYERMKPRLVAHNYNGATMRFKGQDYEIPDELYDTPTPRTVFDSRIRLFQRTQDHFESVVKSTTISAGLTISGITLSGAFSNTKGQVDQMLKNGTRAFSMATNRVDFFQLGVYPGSELDSRFAQAVRMLPATYDARTYGRFIHGWGTHFVNNAQYGCSTNFTTDFDQQLLQTQSMSWVERNVGFSIGYAMFSLNFNSSLAKNTTDFDRQFQESSNSSKTIVGGDGYVLETQGFAAWVQTAEQRPAMLVTQSELLPISELVWDDETRRRHIETAIIDYCNNNQFRENVVRWSRYDKINLYKDEQPDYL